MVDFQIMMLRQRPEAVDHWLRTVFADHYDPWALATADARVLRPESYEIEIRKKATAWIWQVGSLGPDRIVMVHSRYAYDRSREEPVVVDVDGKIATGFAALYCKCVHLGAQEIGERPERRIARDLTGRLLRTTWTPSKCGSWGGGSNFELLFDAQRLA